RRSTGRVDRSTAIPIRSPRSSPCRSHRRSTGDPVGLRTPACCPADTAPTWSCPSVGRRRSRGGSRRPPHRRDPEVVGVREVQTKVAFAPWASRWRLVLAEPSRYEIEWCAGVLALLRELVVVQRTL